MFIFLCPKIYENESPFPACRAAVHRPCSFDFGSKLEALRGHLLGTQFVSGLDASRFFLMNLFENPPLLSASI